LDRLDFERGSRAARPPGSISVHFSFSCTGNLKREAKDCNASVNLVHPVTFLETNARKKAYIPPTQIDGLLTPRLYSLESQNGTITVSDMGDFVREIYHLPSSTYTLKANGLARVGSPSFERLGPKISASMVFFPSHFQSLSSLHLRRGNASTIIH
jgi:hypothetical protein